MHKKWIFIIQEKIFFDSEAVNNPAFHHLASDPILDNMGSVVERLSNPVLIKW